MKIKFFACALASLYCVFFMVFMVFVATKMDFTFWWLQTLSAIAAIVYGFLAYNSRPWANPWD